MSSSPSFSSRLMTKPVISTMYHMLIRYCTNDWLSTGHIKKGVEILVPDDDFTQPVEVVEVKKDVNKNLVITTTTTKEYSADEICLHTSNETNMEILLMADCLQTNAFIQSNLLFIVGFFEYMGRVKIGSIPALANIMYFHASMEYVINTQASDFWQPLDITPTQAIHFIRLVQNQPSLSVLTTTPKLGNVNEVNTIHMEALRNIEARKLKLRRHHEWVKPSYHDEEQQQEIFSLEALASWAAMWLNAVSSVSWIGE